MKTVLWNWLKNIRSASEDVQKISLLLFLVGMHSLTLGLFIYFFTELFYQIFFRTGIVNLFFVRQAGLFMVCLGLFYLSIVITDLKNTHHLILVVITTKVLAVVFLIMNACYTTSPNIIFLAAIGDGCMAMLLIYFYFKAMSTLKQRDVD